jgi:hypothetical protein
MDRSGYGLKLYFLVAAFVAQPAMAFLMGSDGWSSLWPSGDSVVIYVSSSQGNDGNNGLSPGAPVRTIGEGMRRLRNGSPDHLLLRRGDVWYESFGHWSKSGRSLSEPMVVSSYGPSTLRPRVVVDNEPALRSQNRVDYLAFTGVHLQAGNRPAGSGPTGILWLAPGQGLLFEDCLVEGFSSNIVIQGFFGLIEDVRIRRCVVVDAFDTVSLSQGLYGENVDGIWIEECVFDYNGWRAGVYPQTMFNHNVYIHSQAKNLVARGNIVGRASSHGIQARPGGTVDDNLFIRCPIGLSFGYVIGGSTPTVGGIGGRVRGNVMVEGNDIGGSPRGIGVQVANVSGSAGAEIRGNYFLRNASAMPYGVAIELQGDNGIGIHNTLIEGNVCYGYNAGVSAEGAGSKYENLRVRSNYFMPLDTYSFVAHHRFQFVPGQMLYTGNKYGGLRSADSWFRANGVMYGLNGWKSLSGDSSGVSVGSSVFPEPSRTLASYSQLQGFSPSSAAFLAEARQQSRQRWRASCTAANVIDYLMVGFGGISILQDCYLAVEATVAHAEAGPEGLTTGGSGAAKAESDDACTITMLPQSALYAYGQVVTVRAVPGRGEQFLYWEGDLAGETANPVQMVMDDNKSIQAVFGKAEPGLDATSGWTLVLGMMLLLVLVRRRVERPAHETGG